MRLRSLAISPSENVNLVPDCHCYLEKELGERQENREDCSQVGNCTLGDILGCVFPTSAVSITDLLKAFTHLSSPPTFET